MLTPKSILARKSLLSFIVVGVFLMGAMFFVHSAWAQTNFGLNEFGNATNLGTNSDLIGLIARVVNIVLSILGVIALGLIIYAGYLWMTAAGNEEKIQKAKKIMGGGVIGLIIILASFAIASFVLGQLGNATNGGGGPRLCADGTPPPCTGGFGGDGQFRVSGVAPSESATNVKLCEMVQATFNDDVDTATVGASTVIVKKDGGSQMSGDYDASANALSFRHADFESNARYTVDLTTGLKNLPQGLEPAKNLNTPKHWSFLTGTETDNDLPTVTNHGPSGAGACLNPAIQAVFSERMAGTTLRFDNIKLLKSGGAEVRLKGLTVGSGFTSVTVYPGERLESNATYTVVLKTGATGGSTGIRDACGNQLDGDNDHFADGIPSTLGQPDDFRWTFTTGEQENCKPELDSIAPNSGFYGDAATVTGRNLGIANDCPVTVNGKTAVGNCATTQATFRIPDAAPMPPQAAKVRAYVGREASNEVVYSIQSPYLKRVAPNAGPVGQFVTFQGFNFGTAGKAYIGGQEAALACGAGNWGEQQVVVKVPNLGISTTPYKVKLFNGANPTKFSNELEFTVNSDPPTPGLCPPVAPDCKEVGQADVRLNLTGERFGTSGQVKVGPASLNYTGSNGTSINGVGPLQAAEPPRGQHDVTVVVAGKSSNPLDFNVPCTGGPGGESLPHVVNSASCSREVQSPSPHPSGQACTNSSLAVRFDKAMKQSTLPGLAVKGCNTGGATVDTAACTTAIGLGAPDFIYNSTSQVIGYVIPPTGALERNRWYQGVVAATVESGAGVAMGTPYTWYFKVRDVAGTCELRSVTVQPATATIRATLDQIPTPPIASVQAKLTAVPQAENCNSLTNINWLWKSDDGVNLPVVDIAGAQSKAQAEHKPSIQPVAVTALAQGTTKSGISRITVNPLSCVEHDDCNACGTGISRCERGLCTPVLDNTKPIDPTNGAVGTWVRIKGCYFGNQRGTVKYGTIEGLWPDPALCQGGSNWTNTRILSEVPTGLAIDWKGSLEVKRPDAARVLTPEYTVNAIERPGLCAVVPNRTTEAQRGISEFVLKGNKFGALQGSSIVEHISFDGGTHIPVINYKEWGLNEIKVITAPTAPVSSNLADIEEVRVVRDGDSLRASAALDYDIVPSTVSGEPFITRLDPAAGPIAQWVTIIGGNFGATKGSGKVTFAAPGGTRVESAPLPAQCGPAGIVWSDTEIITKVPDTAITGLVQVTTNAGKTTLPNNEKSKTFTINTSLPTPGLCLLNPDTVGNPPLPTLPTDVELLGEGFSFQATGDKVEFSNINPAPINFWLPFRIVVPAPTTTVTGDVRVVKTVGGVTQRSNSKIFTVAAPALGELPKIDVVTPAANATTTCRNPLVSVTVDKDTSAGVINDDQFWLTKEGTCDELRHEKKLEFAAKESWLARMWHKLVPRAQGAAVQPPVTTGCRVQGSVRFVSPRKFEYSLSGPLRAGTVYQVDITSPNVRSATGVPCTASTSNACRWQFTVGAGATVCKVARVDVTPPEWTFTDTTDPPKAFAAQAKSASGEQLPATYAWTTADSDGVITLAANTGTPVNVAQRAKNGEATLQVTATGSMAGSGEASGSAGISVFLCELPWQFTDNPYFRLRYCRSESLKSGTGQVRTSGSSTTVTGTGTRFTSELKVGDTIRIGVETRTVSTVVSATEITLGSAIDIPANTVFFYSQSLPALPLNPAPGQPAGDLVQEYFFKVLGSNTDAIGLRAYSNTRNLSVRAWYDSRPDTQRGNPRATKVDGYPALQDGQSVYVAAVRDLNHGTDTFIYVLSYTQGASQGVVDVFNELVKTWKFNIGLTSVDKAKLQRDLKRLGDLGEIKQLLNSYARSHNAYPDLPSGSFLVGRSTSTWPSWQAALGNTLGRALPTDPMNTFKDCPAGYDPNYCWNADTKHFVCPDGSHVYQYTASPDHRSFTLNGGLEYLAGGGSCTNVTVSGNLDAALLD